MSRAALIAVAAASFGADCGCSSAAYGAPEPWDGGLGYTTRDAGSRKDAGRNNLACAAADGNGFFPACTNCPDPSNCFATGGPVRYSCGCSTDGDCPCGFTCGCVSLGQGNQACGVCAR